MKTFRCPICKHEETETLVLKIEEAYCSQCQMEMVRLHKPNKNQLKMERKLIR